MNQALAVQGLHKRYDAFSLKDVSFSLPTGYIMGFIGPNGAGKSTAGKNEQSERRNSAVTAVK